MDSSFVKLPNCGAKTCFLLTQTKEGGREGFNLTLINGDTFWEGQVTEEDLDAQSSGLEMEFSTYVAETLMALTRCNMGDRRFVYQIKQQADGVIDFLWKKDVGGIMIKMGPATLHAQKDSSKALNSIFTDCINMTHELQRKIQTLETQNQRLAQERQNALKKLDKCVSTKEELEQDLFAKFAAVLNSKKEKIRSLQEGFGDVGDTLQDEPIPSTSSKSTNGKRTRGQAVSQHASLPGEPKEDSDNEEDREEVDTDDEHQTPLKKPCASNTQTGKVTRVSSLNLGDDDQDDEKEKSKPVVRRPARQRGGNKRLPPAKPVLPAVTPPSSSHSGGKTSRRSSVRRSGSELSARSSDNVDPDDLINDF